MNGQKTHPICSREGDDAYLLITFNLPVGLCRALCPAFFETQTFMKPILPVLLLLAGPALADQPDQAARAAQIFSLSSSFGPVNPGDYSVFDGSLNQSAILIDGCMVTVVIVQHHVFVNTFEGSVALFDLSLATLERMPDRLPYAFSEAGAFSGASGWLRFETPPYQLEFKAPLTDRPSLDQALAAPLRKVFENAGFAPYVNDHMTSAAQIESLAAAIQDYKRDFCSPTS